MVLLLRDEGVVQEAEVVALVGGDRDPRRGQLLQVLPRDERAPLRRRVRRELGGN